MTPFTKKVIEIIEEIPHGTVVSYGQVALMAGIPRAARQVGWILANLEEDQVKSKHGLPWWRVINNAGRISIKGSKFHNALTQKKLLEKEGVVVSKELTFDIEKYRWRPEPNVLAKFELSDELVEKHMDKYLI